MSQTRFHVVAAALGLVTSRCLCQDLFLAPSPDVQHSHAWPEYIGRDSKFHGINTENWLGAEYKPAAASSNGLWFHWYDDYAFSVERELAFMKRRLEVTALRVFLHEMVFRNDSQRLMHNMDRFLTSAAKHNISIGWVFFGDDWQRTGASLDKQCQPVKALHNGCWMACPQEDMRHNGTEIFKLYVTEIVHRFRDDPRVLWWEVYNEPHGDEFSMSLRDAAYHWAKSLSPRAPILSNYDYNDDTDVGDSHFYDSDFSDWAGTIYQNKSRGSIITEAGSRWFQPIPISAVNADQVDNGSPLTALNFLSALREEKKQGKVPFVPGVMLCWTIMVGNDNTRWRGTPSYRLPDSSKEPAIPWDAFLFPDGTPVSYTEAAAFRRYATGHDEFLIYHDFLPRKIADGDRYQKVEPGMVWHANASAPFLDGLVEASLWADAYGDGVLSLFVRTGEEIVGTAGFDHCAQSARSVWNDTDIGDAAPTYRTVDVTNQTYPIRKCSASCCAWKGLFGCAAWATRKLIQGERSGDCNYSRGSRVCCWLKPAGNLTRRTSHGTVSGVVHRPPFHPPPPGPSIPKISGYSVEVHCREKLLMISRRTSDGKVKFLGETDLSRFENGIALEAWNILRVTLRDGADGTTISAWLNPMFPETGFVGNPISDASQHPRALPPRLNVLDPTPLPAGGVAIGAGVRKSRIDYVSALPITAF